MLRPPRLCTTLPMLPVALFVIGLALLPEVANALPGSASPDGVWREAEQVSATTPSILDEQTALPAHRVFDIDTNVLTAILRRVPDAGFTRAAPVVLTLPMRDETYQRFEIQESPVFSSELAASNPGIQSYLGQSIDDPAVSAHFVRTPSGFYAFIHTPEGMIYMEPNGIGNTLQSISYSRRDVVEEPELECDVKAGIEGTEPGGDTTPDRPWLDGSLVAPSGATLSSYRLAVTATGEFTQFFDPGGGMTNTLSQIAASVAAVNAIYMPEVAIRLVVSCNNVFTDPATDPFTSSDNSGTSISQNQTSADANCGGSAGYDIGHVFHKRPSGFSGLAGGNTCNNGNKARAYSSVPNPVPGTMIWIVDQLCHEMGHQFTAGHIFNSDVTGCGGGNRSGPDAYEPGSGSTIMSYAAGTRCDYDFPGSNDGYFHGHSFDQITNHRDGGGSCRTTGATGNTPPTVNAGSDYTIPQGTPFKLTASGSDADGDGLTYCWEQFDLGPAGDQATNVNGPLFRSRPPISSSSRTFPILSDILAGNPTPTEILPLVDRTLNFRCTVRDNRAVGGGVNNDANVITVAGSPFFVTAPNGGETLHADCLTTVTWTVGGGSVATNVNILLSTNGGTTFPTTLAANVTNDGSQEVRLPCTTTSQGRIMIEGAGNVFFDVSNTNFTIVNDAPVATMDATGGSVGASCEFLVPYSARITDECRLDATTIQVMAASLDGRSTVDAPTTNVNVVGPDDIRVTGTVRVSDLTGCPARVRVTIKGKDQCGVMGSQYEDVDVVDDTAPVATMSATGGKVGASCEFLVPYTSRITDNCRIDLATVEVTAVSLDGRSTVDTPVANVNVVGQGDVRVTGTVRVSALMACPAKVRVTLTGKDECGLLATKSADVEVIDDTPPMISVSLSPNSLWPPNHMLQAITATVIVTDNCPGVTYVLTSLMSNEPENGLGDGDTAPDIVDAVTGTPDTQFQLRAERSGKGDGRIYTAVYTATDPCGNSRSASAQVRVEHDQSGHAMAVAGFDPDGAGIVPSAPAIALIVPGVASQTASDDETLRQAGGTDRRAAGGAPAAAASLDVSGAELGSSLEAVKAQSIEGFDADGDGEGDYLLIFDADAVRALMARSTEPVALRYVTEQGESYLVPDLSALDPVATLSDEVRNRVDESVATAVAEMATEGGTTDPTSSGRTDQSRVAADGGTVAGSISVTRFRGVQPNPFPGTTQFAYELATAGPVRLVVYAPSGRVVRVIENSVQGAGRHARMWDGRDNEGRRMAPGLYLVRFVASGVHATAKAVLMR